MIALIDYRAGNLTSVRKALAAIGAGVFTPEAAGDLKRAAAIIVPGVGHFGATRALDGEWAETIRELVSQGCPLLGICLGMQWLYEGSDEAPDVKGLALLTGRCYRLGDEARDIVSVRQPSSHQAMRGPGHAARAAVKIPHVGWNALRLRSSAPVLEGVPDGAQVYFTHSYVAPITPDTAAATEHGELFASVLQRDNVAGVQFHPEKSGEIGLRVLQNFVAFTS